MGQILQGRCEPLSPDDQGPSPRSFRNFRFSFYCYLQIIQTPTPRQGERIRLRILSPSAINNPDPAVAEDADPDALEIISELPGHMDLVTGLVSVGWQAWVFFKVLSLDVSDLAGIQEASRD